jgi:hypothetical protein
MAVGNFIALLRAIRGELPIQFNSIQFKEPKGKPIGQAYERAESPGASAKRCTEYDTGTTIQSGARASQYSGFPRRSKVS